MKIFNAQFIRSIVTVGERGMGDLPEVCFIGKSNVGKSSMINTLACRDGCGGCKPVVHFIGGSIPEGGMRASSISLVEKTPFSNTSVLPRRKADKRD